MNVVQGVALVAIILILCAVLAPQLLWDMPSFRHGIYLGDVLHVLVRLALFVLPIALLIKIFERKN